MVLFTHIRSRQAGRHFQLHAKTLARRWQGRWGTELKTQTWITSLPWSSQREMRPRLSQPNITVMKRWKIIDFFFSSISAIFSVLCNIFNYNMYRKFTSDTYESNIYVRSLDKSIFRFAKKYLFKKSKCYKIWTDFEFFKVFPTKISLHYLYYHFIHNGVFCALIFVKPSAFYVKRIFFFLYAILLFILFLFKEDKYKSNMFLSLRLFTWFLVILDLL